MIEKIIEIITRKKNYSDKRLKCIYSNVCGIVGIILNIFLFIIKLIAGLLTNSISIISDAFNNISDAITVFINKMCIRDSSIINILKDCSHKMNKCVVIVTHSKDLAKQADVIFRLWKGKLQIEN